MAKEIEVKARVDNLQSIIEKLSGLGCTVSGAVEQEDSIFADPKLPHFNEFNPDAVFLRIRKEKDKVVFTAKQSVENELSSIEHETIVDSAEELASILKLLGYREMVRVKKKRRKARYGEYEICLDDVDGLGFFIEVEKMADEDGEKIQKELFDFLETLCIKKEDRVLRGYDSLVYEKLHP